MPQRTPCPGPRTTPVLTLAAAHADTASLFRAMLFQPTKAASPSPSPSSSPVPSPPKEAAPEASTHAFVCPTITVQVLPPRCVRDSAPCWHARLRADGCVPPSPPCWSAAVG